MKSEKKKKMLVCAFLRNQAASFEHKRSNVCSFSWCLWISSPFFFICARGSCLVAVFLQNPAPELSGENMDLLSGSLAQLRRFSAASHQGPDDLTCTGPSVAARSRKPLYSSWVHEFSHEFFRKFTLWSAHPWTLTRAHWTLGNEQCKAMWKGTPAHFCGRHLSPLGIPDALPMCSQFPVEPCCLFSCIQAVIGTTALCTGIMV